MARRAPAPLAGATPDATPHDPVASRRRARAWWWAAGAFALVVVGVLTYLGRQSGGDIPPAPRAFCKAAERYEAELERQAAAYERDTARQIRFVEDIAATAPRAVRADARTFLDALRAIEAAPNDAARRRLQDDPDVKRAVDNVNRHWNQGCGVFDRRSGL